MRTVAVASVKDSVNKDEGQGGTRAQILAHATRLFAVHGYGGTSLQAIADAVGIRKPSLLYHFRSKEQLREAVLDALMARWQEVVPQVMRSATSGERRFEAVLSEVLGFFRQDPARAQLLVRELLDRPKAFEARLERHLGHWIALVMTTIERGQQEGLIRPSVDPHAYVLHVVTMMVTTVAASDLTRSLLAPHGALASRGDRDDPGQAPMDRAIGEMVRMARHSLFIDPEL